MTDHAPDPHAITTRDQLRAAGGEAGPRPAGKVIDRIDPICERFIAASPFAVFATIGADGLPDLSPKGDPAGFVAVLDEHTLALPDRLGNKRFDSFENLLENPQVALIFLIPDRGETLRVAGRGRLTRDPDLCARLAVNDRPAQFVVLIDVQEAYLHCSKCMIRLRLWQPDHWPDSAQVPSLAEGIMEHARLLERGLAKDLHEVETIIDDDAVNRLY